MKYLFFIASFSISLFSCKKEKKEVPPPPLVEVPKPHLAVKINGADGGCGTCFSSYYSSGIWGVNFNLGGANFDRIVINFAKSPAVGTYTLVKFGNPSFTYQQDNTYYRGNGILQITDVDTSSNRSIKKLVATFNCTTDTSVSAKTFTLSNGEINVNLK